jgi:hypothetical protein
METRVIERARTGNLPDQVRGNLRGVIGSWGRHGGCVLLWNEAVVSFLLPFNIKASNIQNSLPKCAPLVIGLRLFGWYNALGTKKFMPEVQSKA